MRDEIAIVGILVHGDNHFIVSGPLPDRKIAIALVRQWSLIQIGAAASPVPGEGTMSAAVRVLLEEMSARGITIHASQFEPW